MTSLATVHGGGQHRSKRSHQAIFDPCRLVDHHQRGLAETVRPSGGKRTGILRGQPSQRCLEQDALLRVVLWPQTHSTGGVRIGKFEASSNKDDDMSRGYPSMTALLGFLAIAGYQNRDKIAEMLRGAQSNPADPATPPKAGARQATPGKLGGILGGASIGDTLSGGLRELMDAFKQKGQGEVTDLGLRAGRTSRLLLRNWNRLSAPTCCKLCLSKPGCRTKKFLPALQNFARRRRQIYSRRPIPSTADFS